MAKSMPFFFLMVLLSSFTVVFVPSAGAIPRTVMVPADFSTIQQAIDASEPGGTILISSGIYHENVTVWKALTLMGESRNSTIIDQAGAFAVFHVTADYVAIITVTVKGASIGIWIDNSHQCTIDSSLLMNNDDGIWATSSSNAVMDNNIVANNVFRALYVKGSNDMVLRGNTITGNTHGIYLENCENVSICDNIAGLNDGNGIHAHETRNSAIFRNTVYNNTVGIFLSGSNANTIHGNNFLDNLGQTSVENATSNAWDNGTWGNFWSDYRGTDSNLDGIGETPYIIDANNQDRYPLTNPVSQPQLPADLNGDGKVNIIDVSLIGQAFGSSPGDPRWNPICDLDHNNRINIIDMTIVAKDFGETAQKTSARSLGQCVP